VSRFTVINASLCDRFTCPYPFCSWYYLLSGA